MKNKNDVIEEAIEMLNEEYTIKTAECFLASDKDVPDDFLANTNIEELAKPN